VLTLSTHSDGIDAKVLSNLVLCPMDAESADSGADRSPACLLTGLCHRMDAPIAAARANGHFLTPSDIRAHVFVHSVCWGLFPSPDVQAPEWSLARRIVEDLSVAALITSWEITSQTVATTSGLFHDIARGVPLGRSLAAHLASAEARGQGHQLCLVGDPALRLSNSATQTRWPSPLKALCSALSTIPERGLAEPQQAGQSYRRIASHRGGRRQHRCCRRWSNTRGSPVPQSLKPAIA
jgi:hypothetical protein